MMQMVHVDTLANALSPAAAALLPALMGNLQSALPRLATLMNWLSVMQADGHMVRSQEQGHYTALHSTFHETEHLAVGNWILSYTAVLLASGIETRFGTDGAFGSFIEAWLVQLQHEPDPQWTQVALAFKECASTLHRARTPANQSRELYDRFRWKAGRNSCWETLHQMAGCRLDGNLLTWTAENERHSPVGVALTSLPMQALTFTQEEAIDSPGDSDQEAHKTGPRPVSPTEGWQRHCVSESSPTDAWSPTGKGERSPLPEGSAKQNAQAKSVMLQAACPALCCVCATLTRNSPYHVCPGHTGRRWGCCGSPLGCGQHRKEKRPHMDVLDLWQSQDTVSSPLHLQILEARCYPLMNIWLLLATRSSKLQQLDSILFEGLLQRRIQVHNHTKQTTTASTVYRSHGLPGPKSGLRAPTILAKATVMTEGVRVSPLSAGGEGLCNAWSRLLTRPGKLAEGIQKQLGLFSCRYSAFTGYYFLYTLPRSVPWGKRFRLWKFRYRGIRSMKKRSRTLGAGAVSASQGQFEVVTWGQCPAVNTLTQERPPPCRAAPVFFGGQRRFQLLVFLFSCLGTTQESPGVGSFMTRAPRGGKKAWIKAQRQACQHGHTWYRGRILWSASVPHHPAMAPPSRIPKRPRPGATPMGATARLKIMTLNVGHMSAFLWGELKAYLGSGACDYDYDVVCLQELHWSQHANSAWADGLPWFLLAQTGRTGSWCW